MIGFIKRLFTWNKFNSKSPERQPYESFEDYKERRRKHQQDLMRAKKGQLTFISKTYKKNWSLLEAKKGYLVDVDNSQGTKMYRATWFSWIMARSKKQISTKGKKP